jgi:hypothetical protein
LVSFTTLTANIILKRKSLASPIAAQNFSWEQLEGTQLKTHENELVVVALKAF